MITGVPKFEERAFHNPGWSNRGREAVPGIMEQIPSVYLNSKITQELAGQSTERILLENLREQLAFSELNGDATRALYGVSRNIIEFGINEADESGEAFRLLDHTRWYSTPSEFVPEDEAGVGGSHNKYGSYKVNLKNSLTKQSADTFKDWIMAEGVEVKHPGDVFLIQALHTASHESAHALLFGIGQTMNSGLTDGVSLPASAVYMAANPAEGFTGNFKTDTWIQEERFAEGVALLSTVRSLDALGYQPAEIDVFLRAFEQDGSYATAEGTHQLDHIGAAIDGTTTAADAMSNYVKGNDVHGQLYEGYLGYGVPLDSDAIINQLHSLTDQVKKQYELDTDLKERLVALGTDSKIWESEVRSKQSEHVKNTIAGLKQRRMASTKRAS